MKGKYHPAAFKDITGVGCPMNLVYAKAELAKLQGGQILELIVDDGTPAVNVLQSLEKEGHVLLGKEQLPNECWSLLVRKKSPAADPA